MPLSELPPKLAIDRSRAGRFFIEPWLLGEILRLPRGQEIVSARIDAATGAIELLVDGAGMPPRATDAEPERVTLLCHTGVAGGTMVTDLSWAHDPESRWHLYDAPFPRAPGS